MTRLNWMAALAVTGLLFSACGGLGESVLARNLSTGEISAFSKDEVPSDWVVCSSDECPIPPSVPCQKLGAKVCTLNPECRLKELWCESGVTCSCAACEPGKVCPPCDCPPPTTPVCEYTCIPKLPLLCEELTDENACGARSDCEWADGPCACPTVCEDDGQGGCKPCEAKGLCAPKDPVPPPCPEIAAPPPGYCADGKVIFSKDQNGCVTGYTCELPNQKSCSDLNAAYVAAVAKAKVCNPYSMLPVQECGKQVDSALLCPICPTFVSVFATAELQEMDDLRAKWIAQSCHLMEIACPTIACEAPKSATCMPSSAGLGVCTPDAP